MVIPFEKSFASHPKNIHWSNKFIDRDLNAAKNILHCYNMYPIRPNGMSRTDPKITDSEIKIIKKTLKGVLVPELKGDGHEALMWLRIH